MSDYNALARMKQGGAELEIASGGRITILSGGILDIKTGGVIYTNGAQALAIADLGSLPGTGNDTLTAHSALNAGVLDRTGQPSGDLALQVTPVAGDSPATADALRDDLETNVLPTIRNNIADLALNLSNLRTDVAAVQNVTRDNVSDLAAKVNAILAALRAAGMIAAA